MNAPTGQTNDLAALSDVGSRLAFFKGLQSVTNKIHATSNVEEIMLELSRDISSLFNADRLTIYALGEDRASIVSKVKTGLNAFKDLRLPITEQSIAGFVAMSKRALNISDVYDEAELHRISPGLRFLDEVDKRSGYRTRQMLVAPVVEADSRELLGVVQLINEKSGLPFPPLAEEGLQGLTQTLAVAFAQRQKDRQVVRSKYDYLVMDAVLSAQELDLAQRSARRKGIDVEDVLVEEFQVGPTAIGQALAKFFGVTYEPFDAERIKPLDLIKNLKREYLEEEGWVPIEDSGEGLVILALDPEKVRSSRTVSNVFPKVRLAFRVTTSREFERTLDLFFGSYADAGQVGDLLLDLEEHDDAADSTHEELSAAASNELVRLVNKIIIDAHAQGASDIHIEPRPGKEKVLVRFRKDGSLVPYIEVPASYRASLVARLKIMSDLDISERRRPQDGKIKFRRFAPLDIELRVATIPTAGGMEDVVMRILAAGEPIPIDRLGLSEHNLTRLKAVVTKPYGLFLVCGPTGSGKTTTLHSVLSFINSPDTKIWTAEDPVEITQRGLRQVQVNRKAGLDFASVMRAFLRADPDVIMVGEMRDAETTSIGIEASLTGHLVLSTLHTNSAPESVTRLLDMGMDPFNFGDALLGILAQRLAKRLCVKCRQAYAPDEAELHQLAGEYCADLKNTDRFRDDPDAAYQELLNGWRAQFAPGGKFTLHRAVGCPDCNNTGYRGRVGLHELMLGSDRIKRHIQERDRVAQILATALEEGMRTLRMDGIEKVLAGITDIKQVRAVCIK